MADKSDRKEEGSACGCGGGSCCSGANRWIWILLALAVVGVLFAKGLRKGPSSCASGVCALPQEAVNSVTGSERPTATDTVAASALPRLVDLGSTKCAACKMMTPVLEELKKTYAGKMDVQFIDVWDNPDTGEKYGVQVIPTQIFYDAAGKELFRHEGFFGKEDILTKWKELGVDLAPK